VPCLGGMLLVAELFDRALAKCLREFKMLCLHVCGLDHMCAMCDELFSSYIKCCGPLGL
jgi:hypothetical protein